MIEEWTASDILQGELGIEPDPGWPVIWVTAEMPYEDVIVTFTFGKTETAWWQDGINMISHATGIDTDRVSQAIKTTISEWQNSNSQ